MIHRIEAAELPERLEDLADILVACVRSGASVNFMLPFEADEARAFWRGLRAHRAELESGHESSPPDPDDIA